MTSISYPRAIASCLPIVGPFVAAYYEICTKDSSWPSFDLINLRLAGIDRRIEAAERQQDRVAPDRLRREQRNAIAQFVDENLGPCEKMRTYSLCALVGSVLSVACMVGLVALGILKTYLGFLLAGAFLIHVVTHASGCYSANEVINALHALGAIRA